MAVQFNIREGMTPKQLLQEIKGRISGETQLQIQEFERKLKTTSKVLPTLAIRVDEANKTAIIRVMNSRVDGLKLPSSTEYASYVMGINDEGEYYSHEIQDAPRTIKSVGGLMDWMNRVDEGFTHRVQGDILLQFAPYKEQHGEFEIQSAKLYIGRPFWLSPSIREMGNHRVLVPEDGTMFNTVHARTEYFMVQGREFMLLHPQHATKTIQIPRNMVAILAPQRGRADAQLVD